MHKVFNDSWFVLCKSCSITDVWMASWIAYAYTNSNCVLWPHVDIVCSNALLLTNWLFLHFANIYRVVQKSQFAILLFLKKVKTLGMTRTRDILRLKTLAQRSLVEIQSEMFFPLRDLIPEHFFQCNQVTSFTVFPCTWCYPFCLPLDICSSGFTRSWYYLSDKYLHLPTYGTVFLTTSLHAQSIWCYTHPLVIRRYAWES